MNGAASHVCTLYPLLLLLNLLLLIHLLLLLLMLLLVLLLLLLPLLLLLLQLSPLLLLTLPLTLYSKAQSHSRKLIYDREFHLLFQLIKEFLDKQHHPCVVC